MKTLPTLSSLFFPNGCLLCGIPLGKRETCFCRHCESLLPRTRFNQQPGNPAEQLFYGRCEIERVTCFCYFEKGSAFRKAIHRFKYHDSPRSAFRLGAFYANELSADNWEHPIDLIVPVPLHWRKQLKRGYNQSRQIALGLASVWQKPMKSDLLLKKSHTDTQTHKSLYERFLNTQNSFRLRNEAYLASKHILLVDDVLTSGATLEACAHALQHTAGVKISILTLAFAE